MEWFVNFLGEPEWRAGSKHGRQLMLMLRDPPVLSVAANSGVGGGQGESGRAGPPEENQTLH